MKTKTAGVDDLIVGDEIRFPIETHDGTGCPTDPYQIVDVKIYFITREFTDTTASEYDVEFLNPELESAYREAKLSVCIKSKGIVKAASTSPLALSGLQSVDGIALLEGDRVLVKNQANEADNGIYLASEGVWSRSSDANSSKNITPGMYVFVEEGIVNSATGWTLEASFPISLGSSALRFLLFAKNWSPASPDQMEGENVRRLEELRVQMEASKTKSPFFYKDAATVKKFGGDFDSLGEFFPAWLNPDNVSPEFKSKVLSDNIIRMVENESGHIPGMFFLDWSSVGAREGDYFVCWTWRPTMGNETLSSHQMFHLSGNGDGTSSIPTHRVSPDKYEILMDRYTPEMFKTRISDADLSPEVLSEFGKAVAKGFMFLENQASAVIDLLDANSIQEQLLPLLSNMFNLKVKSSDPTLWRRQIKKAIPNFKKKGSIAGLKEAMKDAGMKLVRFAKLWQVVPRYTHQEHFVFSGSKEFDLSMTPILDRNFSLWHRNAAEGSQWVLLGGGASSSSSSSGHWSESFVEISGSMMTWVGFDLLPGDSVRVLYAFASVPAGEQEKEDYIRSLPLMDDRDERSQDYPPKNWNVHLIEEDDDNFGVLIPVRHPFSDPIVWGRIRTEFPYSENIYNMEEYNGSRRDSFNPCDIDKSFLDRCGQCASSKFNMDLEVEMLSDESLKEMRQIVEEYMPFHAVPNSFNFWGSMNEFVRHNEERIDALVSFSREDIMLAGEAQNIFGRSVYNSDMDEVHRDLLASFSMVNSPSSGSHDWSGVLRNTRTLLLSDIAIDEADAFSDSGHPTKHGFKGMSPDFDSLNVDTSNMDADPFESSNLLEVLGSSTYRYSLSSIDRSVGVVSGSIEPSLVGPVLEYRLSNKIADFNVDIAQYEEIIFGDEDVDFTILGIVSQHDVDLGMASGDAWRLIFGGKEYLVNNILPDGTLLLSELSPAALASGWKLVSGSQTKKEGAGGSKVETGYGLISVNSPSSFNVREKLKIGDYIYIDWSSALRIYRIRAFQKDTENFYISDYNEGDVGGQDIKVYRRVMDKKIGQFGYDSPIIVASDDLQAALEISNGAGYDESSVDSRKMAENYILFIGGEYYTISGVDGQTARLSGPQVSSDTTGFSVTFNVLRFVKENLTLHKKQNPPYDRALESHEFDHVDRSGGSIISGTEAANTVGILSSLLNSSEPLDVLSHDEGIEYRIEYREERK